ncbi:FAD-binding protein [soil metagenome]
MDKRTFLKASMVLTGGTVLSPLAGCTSPPEPLQNWAGNLEYSTRKVHYPKTVAEVQEIVNRSPKIRALGSRHSFSKIADSSESLLSTRDLNQVVSLDKAAPTVTVEAGIKYGELCRQLDESGFALHNLASLPHISVGGSCATATHGSGVRNGNLATGVSAVEMVDAAGEVVTLSRKDGEKFYGAVVGLGALGIVTKLTLDLQPTFQMKQVVYRNLPLQELKNHFLAIMSSGYSVSLFTDWRNKKINQVWVKSKVEAGREDSEIPAELFGAPLATENMHPVEDQPAGNCTEQMGVPGPWYVRMPHFKMGFTPSTGKELQAEYFVPLEQGYEAMLAVEKLHEKISPHLFISEIRTIAADDFWMSPCYRQDCVAIHTTWKQNWDTVQHLLPLVEKQLEPFSPLPHLGKLFALPAGVLQSRYEKLEAFQELARHYDPNGKFRNDFLNNYLFGKVRTAS